MGFRGHDSHTETQDKCLMCVREEFMQAQEQLQTVRNKRGPALDTENSRHSPQCLDAYYFT